MLLRRIKKHRELISAIKTSDAQHQRSYLSGFQARSRGGRWSWTLSPEEIMNREVELGCQKLDFFRFGLFPNSSATDIVLVTLPSTAVETAIAQCTSRCAMASGHNLNTSIVLAAVHGLFWAVSAVEPSLSRPLPPLSPPRP